jgi:hypothetical protein
VRRNFQEAVWFGKSVASDINVFSIVPACKGLQVFVAMTQVFLAVWQCTGLTGSWKGSYVSSEVKAAFLELQSTSC